MEFKLPTDRLREWRGFRAMISVALHGGLGVTFLKISHWKPTKQACSLEYEPGHFIKKTDVYCFQAENNKSGRLTSPLSILKAFLPPSPSWEKRTQSSPARKVTSGRPTRVSFLSSRPGTQRCYCPPT